MRRQQLNSLIVFLAAGIVVFSMRPAFAVNISPELIRDIEGYGSRESVQDERFSRPARGEYRSDNLRDPFKEPAVLENKIVVEATSEEPPEEPLPSLSVQGVLWGGNLPQAIVNNQIVKIGDNIAGARVTDINKDGVTVFFGKKQYILPAPRMNLVPGQEK